MIFWMRFNMCLWYVTLIIEGSAHYVSLHFLFKKLST